MIPLSVHAFFVAPLQCPSCIADYVQPICLPLWDVENEDYIFAEGDRKAETEVAGWGATNERGENDEPDPPLFPCMARYTLYMILG